MPARPRRTPSCRSSTARSCRPTSAARDGSRSWRIEQLAAQCDLRLERETSNPDELRDSQLVKFIYRAALSGEYRNIRRFIHSLEIAPEFLVLENVQLSQDEQDNKALNVSVQIATYYRAGANGAN